MDIEATKAVGSVVAYKRLHVFNSASYPQWCVKCGWLGRGTDGPVVHWCKKK